MTKDDCTYCQRAISKADHTIYEDDIVKAILVEKPSVPGQVELFPKKHYTIFEQVPDREVERLFITANKISTALFESLNMHGTNMIVSNGVAAGQSHAHFSIQMIPRMENDGLNLDWKTKHLSEEEMSTVELMMKPQTDMPLPKEEQKEEKKENKKEEYKDDSDNYLVRQLRRIP